MENGLDCGGITSIFGKGGRDMGSETGGRMRSDKGSTVLRNEVNMSETSEILFGISSLQNATVNKHHFTPHFDT